MTMTIMTEYRLNVTIIPQYHSCPYYYFRISSKYLADNIISDIAPIKPTKYIMVKIMSFLDFLIKYYFFSIYKIPGC